MEATVGVSAQTAANLPAELIDQTADLTVFTAGPAGRAAVIAALAPRGHLSEACCRLDTWSAHSVGLEPGRFRRLASGALSRLLSDAGRVRLRSGEMCAIGLAARSVDG